MERANVTLEVDRFFARTEYSENRRNDFSHFAGATGRSILSFSETFIHTKPLFNLHSRYVIPIDVYFYCRFKWIFIHLERDFAPRNLERMALSRPHVLVCEKIVCQLVGRQDIIRLSGIVTNDMEKYSNVFSVS